MATEQQGLRGPYRQWMFDGSKPVPRTTRWRNANNSDGNLLGLQVDSDVYRGLEDEDQLNLNDVGMEYEDEYMEYDGEHEDDRQEDDDNDKEDSIGSDDDEFVDANESESETEIVKWKMTMNL